MKITPKLLIGQLIKDNDTISESEKINMLAEIMYLTEDELDAWIDLTIVGESNVLESLFSLHEVTVDPIIKKGISKLGKYLKSGKTVARKAKKPLTAAAKRAANKKAAYNKSLIGKTKNTADKAVKGVKNYFKPTVHKAGKLTKYKAWETPVKTAAKVGIGATIGAVAINAVAKRLDACKSNCRMAYKATKDANKYSQCMQKCQDGANTAVAQSKK